MAVVYFLTAQYCCNEVAVPEPAEHPKSSTRKSGEGSTSATAALRDPNKIICNDPTLLMCCFSAHRQLNSRIKIIIALVLIKVYSANVTTLAPNTPVPNFTHCHLASTKMLSHWLAGVL